MLLTVLLTVSCHVVMTVSYTGYDCVLLTVARLPEGSPGGVHQTVEWEGQALPQPRATGTDPGTQSWS